MMIGRKWHIAHEWAFVRVEARARKRNPAKTDIYQIFRCAVCGKEKGRYSHTVTLKDDTQARYERGQ